MVLPINGIFNGQEEIEKLAEYPNIKMFKVKKMTALEPQDDLMELDIVGDKWISSNDDFAFAHVSRISAICVLTARYMADTLGKNKVFFLNSDGLYHFNGHLRIFISRHLDLLKLHGEAPS